MTTTNFNHLYIITGGPGSGKTTLIEALAAQGIHNMPESGRAIIQDQVATGGSALPWSDRAAFAEQMLVRELRSYRTAQNLKGPVIFDRGIPDVVGYLRLCNLPVPSHVEKAARTLRYNQRVFITPPWSEIFQQDAERKQSLEEAQATYEVMVHTYSRLGYQLIQVPKVPVTQRAQFVVATIG
jgi:predicted ATPase